MQRKRTIVSIESGDVGHEMNSESVARLQALREELSILIAQQSEVLKNATFLSFTTEIRAEYEVCAARIHELAQLIRGLES